MVTKKIGILVFVLLFALLIAGCTQQAQPPVQPSEIKIGAVVSTTGQFSNLGNDMLQAAQLAANEINAQGGISIKEFNAKVPITIIAGDEESTQDGAQKAVTKLILNDNVDILVGGYSSALVPVEEPIVLDHKVTYIISGASSPIVTRRTDINTSYFFHHCPTTADYGKITTMFIDEIIRPRVNSNFNFSSERPLRLALLYVDNAFGQGVVAAVNDTVTNPSLNTQIVSQQSYARTSTDFRTQLTAIKAAKPDVVYLASDPDSSAMIIPQARREIGLNTIFVLVENNDDPIYYTGVKEFGDYSIIESRYNPYLAPADVSAANEKFKAAYKAKYGTLPGMMATSTYEAVYIAAKAIEDAGTLNKSAIRDAVANIQMPQLVESMVNGTISFTKDYHESKFNHFMVQLHWNGTAGVLNPTIIWPDNLKERDFELPEWYSPGSP
jgi:branched-chain amino acid transport system substrate-binding protein